MTVLKQYLYITFLIHKKKSRDLCQQARSW